ncbi:MAG: hypothetical protein EXR65_04120 [Dehalococcoidia bacterium]|nr:hypothetical protein [Dehalococcoidia bacterium]
MDLLHLVDRLEELVASSQKMPIGSRAIIDRRLLLDIVDQMRIVIPQEVREAHELMDRNEEVRRDAEEEARMIVARAEERAARLVEQHEVTKAARARAEELAAIAERRLEERVAEANAEIQERLDDSRRLAERQLGEADAYAAELLRRLERQLRAFTSSVQAGLGQLEPAAAPAAPASELPERGPHDVAREQAELVPAGGGARGRAAHTGAAAAPIPLHSERPVRDRDQEPELENLLRRPPPRPQREHRGPALRGGGANVIDDFAMPRLDDEPPFGEQR